MSGIFISYRREDSSGSAGRLCQDLRNRFGAEQVFFDVDDITVGADYRQPIDARIAAVTVFLAVIGPDWGGSRKDRPGRRIDEPDDPVRKEIEAALARNIEIIPVLVEGATMPGADTLPVSLQPLAYRNAVELRHTRWNRDVGDFADAIAAKVGQPARPAGDVTQAARQERSRSTTRSVIFAVIVIALAAGAYGFYGLYQGREADEFLDRGIDAQYDPQPNLERARQAYLQALELRPNLAPAHYHLAHVYAYLQAPDLARNEFQLALRIHRGLDPLQIAVAQKQLDLLVATVANGPAAVSQAVLTAPKIEVPAGTLPYVEPDTAVRQRLEMLVSQMFAPDRDTRVTSTTTLVLDPASISDALPLAVELAERMQSQGAGANRSTIESGVINTFVLMRSATPVGLGRVEAQVRKLGAAARNNGAQTAAIVGEIERKLDQAHGKRPVASIRIANEAQRAIAEALSKALVDGGYNVSGISAAGDDAPVGHSEVHSVGASDQALARWQARKIWKLVSGDVAIKTLSRGNAKIDTYEVWLDRDLCSKRQTPECKSHE